MTDLQQDYKIDNARMASVNDAPRAVRSVGNVRDECGAIGTIVYFSDGSEKFLPTGGTAGERAKVADSAHVLDVIREVKDFVAATPEVADKLGFIEGPLRRLGNTTGINVDAGHPQPFLAGRINLRQFGDSRHLPQQPQRINPALLNRARRPRQLRRPAQLAFNFLDELADLCRCGLSLHIIS